MSAGSKSARAGGPALAEVANQNGVRDHSPAKNEVILTLLIGVVHLT